MAVTTLGADELVQLYLAGIAMRGTSPFENPRTMHRYQEVLTRRGEDWAASVLCRNLSRRSLTWGPWLEHGEPEILVLADLAERTRKETCQ
jgi:hypothetical protein